MPISAMPTIHIDPNLKASTSTSASATTSNSISTTSPSASPTMRRASMTPQPVGPISPPQASAPWQISNISTTSSPQTTSAPYSAAASKKTTQVIERLTTENERLRRELKAERALREDSVQQQRALRAMADATEEKLSTLKYQIETSSDALSRKERRIDDLRQHLEQANERSKRAEEQAAIAMRRLDDIGAETAKQVAEAKTIAKRAESAYDTLVKEYKVVKSKVDNVDGDFKSCRSRWSGQLKNQEQRIEKLEILLDQTRQTEERMVSVNREQARRIENFEGEVRDFRGRYQEMVDVVGKMRWVMGLQEARNKPNGSIAARIEEEPEPTVDGGGANSQTLVQNGSPKKAKNKT